MLPSGNSVFEGFLIPYHQRVIVHVPWTVLIPLTRIAADALWSHESISLVGYWAPADPLYLEPFEWYGSTFTTSPYSSETHVTPALPLYPTGSPLCIPQEPLFLHPS